MMLKFLPLLSLFVLQQRVAGFLTPQRHQGAVGLDHASAPSSMLAALPESDGNYHEQHQNVNDQLTRRGLLQQSLVVASILAPTAARAQETPAFVQSYSDFTPTADGYSYRDVNPGKDGAAVAQAGDRVVFDWSGYTIGYFGRPFQAKGGPQGGAFDKDLDYARTVIGSGDFVAGLEKGLTGMKPGGVRQIVVPYGDLSYPADDLAHERVGPKPSTFSGQRALNFVLENPRVDRTLLFNVKVIRVDKPNGKGGFLRG